MSGLEFFPDSSPAQLPADVGVVMPTVLRSGRIAEAVASVFNQAFPGRIQLMIGVDLEGPDLPMLRETLEQRPSNVSALILRLPYSTSVRNGGVYNPLDGGTLRAVLSLMSNSRQVAYLDDDNVWLPDHLASLTTAIGNHAWVYSQRMLVDAETGQDLCVDRWHSAGPDAGEFAPFGGFVDTNCLLVNNARIAAELGSWAQTVDAKPGNSSDKRFFLSISRLPHTRVDMATVRYRIRRTNRLWLHLSKIGAFQEVPTRR
jgi:hypothetical protein